MHTPLPWELCDGGTSIIVGGGPNNDDIADFSYCDEHTVSITREEAMANARLFMAAPMMYQLLERLTSLLTVQADSHLASARALNDGMRAIFAIVRP